MRETVSGLLTPVRAVAVGVLLVVLVVVLMLTLHRSDSSAEPGAALAPGQVVTDDLDGQRVSLELPAGNGTPTGLAIWFHGQGGNVNDRLDTPFLESLRDSGWAIASADFHRESWGNAASTTDTIQLQHWAEQRTGLSTTLWVSGSMGGSVSLNALTHGVKAPTCWYGVKPAIALHHMGNVPAAQRFISIAYPDSVPRDRDTVKNVSKLPLTTTYRVVASHQDTWVHFDQNAGPLIAKLQQRGGAVSLLTAVGLHQDPSHFNAGDLLAFADSCLTDDPGLPDASSLDETTPPSPS